MAAKAFSRAILGSTVKIHSFQPYRCFYIHNVASRAWCFTRLGKTPSSYPSQPKSAPMLTPVSPHLSFLQSYAKFYDDPEHPPADEVERRVMDVCKKFDKITADSVTQQSTFMNELGLDSLDHVELIMAMEDEFGFEIPDADAEKLLRPNDIIAYICKRGES